MSGNAPLLTCEQVGLLPSTEQCAFVHQQCSNHPGLVNSFTLYYCIGTSETARHWVGIPILVLLLLALFGSIGLVTGNCLVPNLNAITVHLRIPENISGLTLLAFANGSPDIISTYTSFKTGNVMLAFGEIIGAAYFINTVVIGSIFLIKPFDIVPHSTDGQIDLPEHRLSVYNARGTYLRDVSFFIVAVLILIYCVQDGMLTRTEMMALISIYLGYVTIIVTWQWYFKKEMDRIRIDHRARSMYNENVLVPPRIDEHIEIEDTFNYNPQIIRNLEFETILSGLTAHRKYGIYVDNSGVPYTDNDNLANEDININSNEVDLIEPPRKSLVHSVLDIMMLPFVKLFRHSIPILTSSDYEGEYKPALTKLMELLTSLVISPIIVTQTFFPQVSLLWKVLMIILAISGEVLCIPQSDQIIKSVGCGQMYDFSTGGICLCLLGFDNCFRNHIHTHVDFFLNVYQAFNIRYYYICIGKFRWRLDFVYSYHQDGLPVDGLGSLHWRPTAQHPHGSRN
ncbi:unnamed protein product [Pichia kudriavzevii]